MANNNEDKSEPGEKPTEMNPQGEVEVENVANGEIPPVKSKLKADVPEFVPATTGRSEVDGTDGLPTVEVDVDCDPQPQFIPYSCPTG